MYGLGGARACSQTTMLASCSCPTIDSRSLLVQQGGSTSEVWIEGAQLSELEALARISVSSSIPKKMRHVDGPSRFSTFSGKPRRAQVFSSSERIVFAIVALRGSNCNNIIKKMLQVSSLAG